MPIEPNDAALKAFLERDDRRPMVLLQLLRFADGGRDHYLAYSRAAQPILTRIGAQIIYAGEAGPPLLATEGQAWDAVVLVRYPSRTAFVEMLADPAYQAIASQRRAALREVVMLPMNDWPGR